MIFINRFVTFVSIGKMLQFVEQDTSYHTVVLLGLPWGLKGCEQLVVHNSMAYESCGYQTTPIASADSSKRAHVCEDPRTEIPLTWKGR